MAALEKPLLTGKMSVGMSLLYRRIEWNEY